MTVAAGSRPTAWSMYVGGTWVDSADGAVLESVDPTTEEVLSYTREKTVTVTLL
jgi:hypothetical protein